MDVEGIRHALDRAKTPISEPIRLVDRYRVYETRIAGLADIIEHILLQLGELESPEPMSDKGKTLGDALEAANS